MAEDRYPPRNRPGHGPAARMMPVEKAKDFKGSVRRLAAYMAHFKWQLICIAVFAIASTVFNVIGPKILGMATTEIFNGITAKIAGTGSIDFDAVARILVISLCLYLGSALCSFVQGWLMAGVSQRTCYGLRAMISRKIDRMPMGYIERTSTGDVLSRITNDVDTLGQTLNQGITQLVTSVVTIVGVLIMMFSINWMLTLITLVILPISVLLLRMIVKRSQKYFKAQQRNLGVINGQVEETFSGHTEVVAFNRQDAVIRAFDETNEELYESAWKSQFISGLMMPIMNLVSNLAYVAVAVVGTLLAARGIITAGDIQAFIQYVRNFTQPIQQLTQVTNVFQQMAAAAERVFEFLDEDEVVDNPSQVDVTTLRGRVDFDHVRFGYEADKSVIRDFSAHVDEGRTVAIVGPTGAGKTTMVKLLMRFYDVDAGTIAVDGHDIRTISPSDLRSMVAMVLQDTWLFKGSIRDNIRYGDPSATDEQVQAAAKAAFAHHFIMTQPDGYDTEINEDGTNISQGQRQLLTIARAILADRRMLILDEATSSVDTRTEERIQAAMDNLMKGRTSFVIAHRLSTIRNADLILVMDGGDIVEQGTHDDLLALDGFYARLYNAQFSE